MTSEGGVVRKKLIIPDDIPDDDPDEAAVEDASAILNGWLFRTVTAAPKLALSRIPDYVIEDAIRVATPHIDRAARIDELRQLAGAIGKRADDSRHDNEEYSESYVLETVHTRIAERLMELLEGQGDE